MHRLDAEECKDSIIEQASNTILQDARNSGYEETAEWNTLSYAVKRLFKFFDMGGSTKIYYPKSLGKIDSIEGESEAESEQRNAEHTAKLEERQEALELFKEIDKVRREVILKKSLPEIQSLLEDDSNIYEDETENTEG